MARRRTASDSSRVKPRLTVEQILAWADAYHAATGHWPRTNVGMVPGESGTTWAAICKALQRGMRGLPGGTTLIRLLHEHRGVRLRYTDLSLRTRNEKRARVEEERRTLAGKTTLSSERVLEWADAHHSATGRWPTKGSGPIQGVPGETWSTIAQALRRGARGLPGPTTIGRFLMLHGRGHAFALPPEVTIERLLAAALAYHAEHGAWPTAASPEPVPTIPGQTWGSIDGLLRSVRFGAAVGALTLSRLLSLHRPPQRRRLLPDLTVEQILRWADAHHAEHGRWPHARSGGVAAAPGERWKGIDQALSLGGRGLPGGTRLARLLAECRGARYRGWIPDLTVEQILTWADDHYAATGKWPNDRSGAVIAAPGETWSTVRKALWKGQRGLPRRLRLPELLDAHRPAGRRRLTPEQIRAWAEAHRAATGRWPTATSGEVAGVPGESWCNLGQSLRYGYRGLKGGSSLALLLGLVTRPRAISPRPPLTVAQIVAWGEAHRAATGRWPNQYAGAVAGAPGEKWKSLDQALRCGFRGLPRGITLHALFAGRSPEVADDETPPADVG
jgi:hypothetical protein